MIMTIQSYHYNYKHLELPLNYNRFAWIPRTSNISWNRLRFLLDRQAEALINTWWLLMACLICCGVNVLAFLCKICFSASWSRRVMNISIARLIKTGTAAATFPISSSDLIIFYEWIRFFDFGPFEHLYKKLWCYEIFELSAPPLKSWPIPKYGLSRIRYTKYAIKMKTYLHDFFNSDWRKSRVISFLRWHNLSKNIFF